MLISLDESNFNKETDNGLKLVVFMAPWCSFCKKEHEVLRNMDIWIGNIDGDESPELARKFGVLGFPTFVLLKNGKEITKFSGFKDKFEIMNILSSYI